MIEKSIKVDLATGICRLRPQRIIVRTELGLVILFISDLRVEMTTVTAHKVGLDLIKKARQALPKDYIRMEINNKELDLLPQHATQIGAGLLRKADTADDWQLGIPKRGY